MVRVSGNASVLRAGCAIISEYGSILKQKRITLRNQEGDKESTGITGVVIDRTELAAASS